MRLRLILLFLTIISGAVLSGLMYFRWNTQPPAVAQGPLPEAMVVAPMETVSTGMLIKPTALTFVKAPADAASGIYFDRARDRDPTQQANDDKALIAQVVGAVSRRYYQPNQPITRDSVVKPGDSGFLAAVLSPGMRAITIGVTSVSGAAGLIYPGDKVDLILTQSVQTGGLQQGSGPGAGLGTVGAPQSSSTAETVATDIRVIAIDQQLQANASPTGGKEIRTVTVEVEPRAAVQIALASKLGELSLTIRSLQPGSPSTDKQTNIVWAADLAPPLKNLQRLGSQKVLVIRGNDSTTVQTQP